MTASNGYAGREDFFAATARRFDEVPLWNGKKARIRSITAGEWLDLDIKNFNTKGGGILPSGVRVSDLRLVIASVCDGNGQPLFTEQDIPRLEPIDFACIAPVLRKVRTHCGVKEDVEGAIKNSEASPGGDSLTSHSPEPEPQGSTG